MTTASRMDIAIEGVKAVIDTFTDVTYAGIVRFSSSATAYSNTLQPMSKVNRDAMKSWADNLQPGGGT